MITTEKFLNIAKNTEQVQPYKLGIIDPNYTDGKPRILFDGEAVVSEKEYPRIASYSPAPGDRVIIARLAGSYVILGKVI